LLRFFVWDFIPFAECVKSRLRTRVKEEALRTYLLTFSAQYDFMRLEYLCVMFDLELERL